MQGSHFGPEWGGRHLFRTVRHATFDCKCEEEKAEEDELLLDKGISTAVVKDRDPTVDQLEKLSKLEPLPLLLRDFDLDAHVGLIQKLLQVDRRLVERQSTLSG